MKKAENNYIDELHEKSQSNISQGARVNLD
jgi:hypothetical protein